MKINYLEADCGAGKTHFILNNISANPGRYVFAVNKIDLIKERIHEFGNCPGAAEFVVEQCHTQSRFYDYVTIGEQIQTFPARHGGTASSVLLFVTHESLQITDWSAYQGWQLIIDEVPTIWSYIEGNFTQSSGYVQQFFDVKECEDVPDYLQLSLTAAGRELRTQWKGDEIVSVIKPFMDGVAKRSLVMVNKNSWTRPTSRKLRGFALFRPEHLSVFSSVTILGNRFTDSLLHRCWSKCGVEFLPMAVSSLRKPVQPISERLEIIYFSDPPASMRYFRSDENPLQAVADWCRRNLGSRDAYYTVNESLLLHFTINGWSRISVMAHGHNHLKDKETCVFMAALKGKPHEYKTILEAFGVTRREFDLAREKEALYQFLMRSNLRDYESRRKVKVYVFSRSQAEFLRAVTGASIQHQDIGLRGVINKGGRPKGSTKLAA